MSKEDKVSLDDVMRSTNEICGAHTLFEGVELKVDPPRLPTGVFSVDLATGGGLPIHASTCLWGPDCLDAESIVQVQTWDRVAGKRHSHKPVSMKRLFERFHNLSVFGKGKYIRRETSDALYTVASVNEEGGVFQNPILDIVYCGVRPCFRITTKKGFHLVSTEEHEYMLYGNAFKRLGDLAVKDMIYIHNNTRWTGRTVAKRRPEVLVKYHPRWPKKIVNKCLYFRGKVSRAVYEAAMNNLSYDEYIWILNNKVPEEIDQLQFIQNGIHIHHKDDNPLKNELGNLESLVSHEHLRLHCLKDHNKFRFVSVLDEVVSIEYAGEQGTYDLVCPYPNNNYVANGIVVHNSGGKTSLAMNVLAMAELICWRCFKPIFMCECSKSPLLMRSCWLDIEGTFDRDWATDIGSNPEKYLMGVADYGEQFINIGESVLRADDCGLLIADSLGALTPMAEMEAPMENQFIGLHPRMVTRMVRKLKQRLLRERKREHPCAVLFVNQLRINVGQLFGDNETMPGGKGLQHEFSLLLRCVKKALKKDGPDKKYFDTKRKKNIAQRHSFAIRKEKVLTLAGVGEYVRIKEHIPEYGLTSGMIDDYGTLLTYAKEYGVISGSAGKWKYFEHKAKKLDDIRRVWLKKPDEKMRTQMAVIKRAKARLRGEKDAP